MKRAIWLLLCVVGWQLLAPAVRADDTVPAAEHTLYAKGCGGCHVAYPPGLLPGRSWEKLLNNVAHHFGEQVTVSQEDIRMITDYVMTRAAERSSSKLAAKIVQSLRDGETPLRITEIPYIRHEHEDVPQRLITGNPQVKSLSQCGQCHPRAQEGSFRENEVDIPGHGRWQD